MSQFGPEDFSQSKDSVTPVATEIHAPAINLPKGGGAIRGMGEKFAANPVTGTGSMSVPIATSPGRSGFGPQLALSYDSGSGNSPFGFGWNLSLPAVTRKTDKGLPQYLDAQESDAFILSGSEDLVPVYRQDQDGNLVIHEDEIDGYLVRRYRPRIEGLFARIECWTRIGKPSDVHWRSISKDNILILYGNDADSRIYDPEDDAHIFSWLISETRDDKGNGLLYRYKPEDGIGADLNKANERNRGAGDDPHRAANRYLKRILYGNRRPLLDDEGHRPRFLDKAQIDDQIANALWMFEVVFDYGEHDVDTPKPNEADAWVYRNDPFSSYRSGFEVRTTRLCQRVLMFHHFDGEAGVGKDCLVRSTDFTYSDEQDPTNARNPVYTFLQEVTQTGYRCNNGGYDKRCLPSVVFKYTQPVVQETVHDVAPESLENLPIGVDGTTYQWTDLHGEGIPGVLTEQASAWFYKRNLSPISKQAVEFGPLECVTTRPNIGLASGQAQFLDLAGDGQPDLVVLDGPMPGLNEHDADEGWGPFRPFMSRLNRNMHDPNLRFVDLDGDGHADVLITEDDALVWHASLLEEGFGPAQRVAQALDEEKGPRLVFADGTQSIYLADLSGDGLTDLARIRNSEVCYWPNLGYGRFGTKVTMDHAPLFDSPDQFDQKRIRLADIDGSGTTDIIYLHRDGVRLYFNQSGNSWSAPQQLKVFPGIDDVVSIVPTDLMGNGTACLVWSSPLPGDAGRPMRYVNLMGDQKPHLLVSTINNLGAETIVHYAPSTKFYLQDKRDGNPWITRLPFPVHVVERVETYDYISRNRFVTRYAYHHGYFDGIEREFRGFGMVEQWDTEALAALTKDGTLPAASNEDAVSHVPAVHTKTWFHTGVYLGRDHVSDFFAGLLNTTDQGEYFRGPGLNDVEARALLLPDTVLPPDLSPEEEREACRALKGSMLRQEIYADDAGPDATQEQIQRALTPYTVAEQNFSVRREQARGANRHAVFFTHPREAITYHYERNPADPRIQHALTLEVDRFGNVLKQAAIGYGRRSDDASLPTDDDRAKQRLIHITCTENSFTYAIVEPIDCYRTPLPAESCTYELRKPEQEKSRNGLPKRYEFEALLGYVQQAGDGNHDVAYEDIEFNKAKQAAIDDENEGNKYFRRLIERVRTRYRKDDLSVLLPLRELQPLALPGESYKLAFTPGLLAQVFQRDGIDLLPDPNSVLGGQGEDRGGYIDLDGDKHWWIPAGQVFLSPNTTDTTPQEFDYARQHFFLPHRTRDPFATESVVTYDAYDLLLVETRDALDNCITVGERLPDDTIDATRPGNDYRVLQPWRVMDPNRNRTQVAFDILGMVVGTAVMGKPEETLGDSLEGFTADLADADILDHLANPLADPHGILARATTRLVYDLFAYQRTKDTADPQPAVVYTLARETHDADSATGDRTRIQHSFSYSDGLGREIQKKIQAEPGPLVKGGPDVSPRWVGSGWTIFNNKGKPVRQYEPFFSKRKHPDGTFYSDHRFEFGVKVGVSPILFYDPVERVIATLHPNDTYEKVVFDPWQQTTYDINDTVLGDPRQDRDIQGYVEKYFATQTGWKTWLQQRLSDPQHPPVDTRGQNTEQDAAVRTLAHADTPTTAHFDALGRPFLTVAHNKVVCPDHDLDGRNETFCTRVELDIEGNQRAVRDAIEQAGDPLGRVVMRYAYDMLGNRIHQLSMEAGARWMLGEVAGKPIRAWDSRGHSFRTAYDPLRRPLRSYVTNADPANPGQELLTERLVYGEQHPEAQHRNLRGKLFLHLDQAGFAATERCDFKGNPLCVARRLASGDRYKQVLDWRSIDANQVALPPYAKAHVDLVELESAFAPVLEADAYTSCTTYDALNRPLALTTPHTPTMTPSVIRPGYNEANLLEHVEASLRGATANGQPVWTPFVINIDYDAKGQRQRIDYGNGASTVYDYDSFTFRLVHLLTRRNAIAFPDDDPQPPPAGWPGSQVQNLQYTYDPAGNITHIRDDAQQTIYFRNRRVEPSNDYTYDALYRLIAASGREHLGQGNNLPIPHSHDDARRTRILHPGDGNAMGTYTERYVYDAVGNFLKMQHARTDAGVQDWTRRYDYSEASLTEAGKCSNRLTRTTIDADPPEPYSHDAHGNMIGMPHLPLMQWDYRDQLQATARQVVNNGGTAETTYYVYDSAGQRVRKVTERQVPAGQAPTRMQERIYLGGFEIFREFENDGTAVKLERETLHIMDDKQRIALVETKTKDADIPASNLPETLIRYQFGNHLGSASLELDDQAQIISYEEYAPYGSTTYQAVRSQTETAKRYRYTGKERDDESGLYYHGARYYAPWLGRWSNCDPVGLLDGVNTYLFVKANPLRHLDLTGGAASDVASIWEGKRQEYRSWLASQITPKTGGGELLGLAVTTLAVELGAGLVDLARLGEGVGEGGLKGYAKDALRVVGITTLAWGVARTAGLTGSPGKPPQLNQETGRAPTDGRSASAGTEPARPSTNEPGPRGTDSAAVAEADAAGVRLRTVIQEGGPMGGKKAIAAVEANVPGYEGQSPLRTRSGEGTPTPGQQKVPHAPAPSEPTMRTSAVENAPGEHSGLRDLDAEIKVLSAVKDGLPANPAGTVDLAANKPLCSSCTSAMFDFTGDYPGIRLRVFAPARPVRTLDFGPLDTTPSQSPGAPSSEPGVGIKLHF